MDIKVSILIPVYNTERFISKCIQTVIGQTYKNLEVVILDDATPDNSMTIIDSLIKNYNNHITLKIIHNEKNEGIAYSRNKLMDNATGDYILFVDSDDFLELNAIELLVNIARKTDADIVRCSYFENKKNHANIIHLEPWDNKTELLKKHICAWNSIEAMWQLLIRNRLIKNNHLYFAEGINASEDHLMMIKLYFYADKIADSSNPVYHYRVDNYQSATHINPKAFHNSMYKAMDNAIAFLKEKGVYDLYQEEVLTRTFLTKQTFLLNKNNRDLDFYVNIHPECNSYYRKFKYNYSQIILFKLAESRKLRLLKFLTRFI